MSSFVLKWEFQAIKCHCLKANSFHRLVTFVHRAIIAINLMTSLCFSHYFIFVNNAKHVKGRFIKTKQNKTTVPLWLVWLRGLVVCLRIKGSPFQLPVRAQAWVSGQVPRRGRMRDNHTFMFLSLSFSLPSPFLKINK